MEINLGDEKDEGGGHKAETLPTLSSQIAEALDRREIPEKPASLEVLAAHGFAVPKHRLYMGSSDAGSESPSESFRGFYDSLVHTPNGDDFCEILVRSAHPLESAFPGGAFESLICEVPRDDISAAWRLILEKYQEMRDLARPENSLAVARTQHFGKCHGFRPEEMGVYLNEYIRSANQMTVMPFSNGAQLCLAYKRQLDPHGGSQLVSLVIPNTGDIESSTIDKLVEDLKVFDGHGKCYKLLKRETIEKMLHDTQKAQGIFSSPQEMEIILAPDDSLEDGTYYFVQSKDAATKPHPSLGEQAFDTLFAQGVPGLQ